MPGKAIGTLFRIMSRRMLNALGSQGVLTCNKQDYEPLSGEEADNETDFPINCTPPEPFKETRIDGVMVKATDLSVFVDASVIKDEDGNLLAPESTGWTFTFNNEIYPVVGVGPVVAGNNTILYELQLRK